MKDTYCYLCGKPPTIQDGLPTGKCAECWVKNPPYKPPTQIMFYMGRWHEEHEFPRGTGEIRTFHPNGYVEVLRWSPHVWQQRSYTYGKPHRLGQ